MRTKIFEEAYKQLIVENEEQDNLPTLKNVKTDFNAEPSYLKKIIEHAEKKHVDRVLQVYLLNENNGGNSDNIDLETTKDAKKARVVMLGVIYYLDDPDDFDYIILEYKKSGKTVKFEYSSDEGDIVQQLGKYADYKFVMDTMLYNVMTDYAPLSDWKRVF